MKEKIICEGCGDPITIGFLNDFDEKFCEACKKELEGEVE